MQDIFKRLKNEFSAKQRKNYIDIAIPVVMRTNGGLLNLRIKPKVDCYEIIGLSNLFSEITADESQDFYYQIFEKYDNNYHYEIKLKNNKLHKEYSIETNIVVAIDEFIRFFIMLDDFMINNNVIGHEENFLL